ncbi:hypothetical protein LSH36_134g03009 [Paralvinella palmiformis]|uniref:Uncharacterized protein n=1 Tax=Paralvinella palmiformis TaxID=53620 RepID=A0AAD9JXP0_9ANNE|nr:hypothetical protein LSH36_134g03009 [Paralvinella palmiformis]
MRQKPSTSSSQCSITARKHRHEKRLKDFPRKYWDWINLECKKKSTWRKIQALAKNQLYHTNDDISHFCGMLDWRPSSQKTSLELLHHHYASGTFHHGTAYPSGMCTKSLCRDGIERTTPVSDGIPPFHSSSDINIHPFGLQSTGAVGTML